MQIRRFRLAGMYRTGWGSRECVCLAGRGSLLRKIHQPHGSIVQGSQVQDLMRHLPAWLSACKAQTGDRGQRNGITRLNRMHPETPFLPAPGGGMIKGRGSYKRHRIRKSNSVASLNRASVISLCSLSPSASPRSRLSPFQLSPVSGIGRACLALLRKRARFRQFYR